MRLIRWSLLVALTTVLVAACGSRGATRTVYETAPTSSQPAPDTTTTASTAVTNSDPYTQTPFPVVVPQSELGNTVGITYALNAYFLTQAQQAAGSIDAPEGLTCGAVKVSGMVGDVPEPVVQLVDGDLGVYECGPSSTDCTLYYVNLQSGQTYVGPACQVTKP